ncbi:hypothetical protein CA11_07140 [Gimesia maris]|nr:hypothetical protein CA11_07140 [Gimesia maris]
MPYKHIANEIGFGPKGASTAGFDPFTVLEAVS